jgi:hydrogenase maturation protease
MLLVLAYGNPLRDDDGVAWKIAEHLHRRRPDVEIVCVHQLVPELCEHVSRAEGVLFLDAAVGTEPGRVAVRGVEAEPQDSGFGHVLSPSGLLELVRRLYEKVPPALLATVTGRDFSFGSELSPPVEAALPEAYAKAQSALERLAASGPA